MTVSWIAEHVPWYSIEKTLDRPWRDEDVAMSMPVKLGDFATETDARVAVASDLTRSAEFGHVARGGDAPKYLASASAILAGVDGVRIYGRFWRVRQV